MNWEFPNNVGVREWQVFFPHLDLLLVPEPAGFKSDETWEIWVFFSAKNAVKLCSKVYEFTTLFLN